MPAATRVHVYPTVFISCYMGCISTQTKPHHYLMRPFIFPHWVHPPQFTNMAAEERVLQPLLENTSPLLPCGHNRCIHNQLSQHLSSYTFELDSNMDSILHIHDVVHVYIHVHVHVHVSTCAHTVYMYCPCCTCTFRADYTLLPALLNPSCHIHTYLQDWTQPPC